MIVVNKLLIEIFPFSLELLLVQNFVASTFFACFYSELRFEMSKAQMWVPCLVLFCINIYTSLQSLSFIGVPTFTVFRNTMPIFSCCLDAVVLKQAIELESLFFLLVILSGAYIYAHHNLEFNVYGYAWAFMHVLSMTFYAFMVKRTLSKSKFTKIEMSFYNNIMSLPVLSVMLVGFNSFESFGKIGEVVHNRLFMFYLALSSFFGFALSISGFYVQDILSAVSYLTLNNLSKIPAIIISSFVWKISFLHYELLGMALSIVGGYLYSMSCHRKLLPAVLSSQKRAYQEVSEEYVCSQDGV